MAAFAQAAEDELACPICFELFVDPNTPKILPACGHVSCEVCLKNMVAEKMAKTCPECRKEICIPKGGVISFLTNFRLRNLAEKHGQKVHEPVNKQICPDHEEKMHYFCTTCNRPACQVCLTLKHKGDEHVIEGIKEMYTKQKGQMQATFKKVSITKGEDALQHLAGLETKLQNPDVAAEKQIDECIESHIKQLREQGNELKQLQQATDTKLDKVDQKLASVKQNVELARQSYQPVVVTSENSPDYEYIVQYTHLTEPLKRADLKEYKSKLGFTPHAAARFAPNKLDMNVGCILAVMPDRPRKVKLIQTLHGFKNVTHVAHSSTGLLAVSCRNKKVIIYHKVNRKYKKKLNLNLDPSNEFKPYDVAIHPDGRFIVARWSCIEVYSPEGNYLNKIEAQSFNRCPIHQMTTSVTTTSDGRILAGGMGDSGIIEFDQTGNIVRIMKTNICPIYMTLIHDTHIAMSDSNAGKVSVMDMETGQETLSIDIPVVWGIGYDEQTQCLLINEWRFAPRFDINTSGVITQYSYTTGKLVACLEQGLREPRGMTTIGDGNLAVTNGETVNIYKFK